MDGQEVLGLLESLMGVALPSGGAIIDDVYGHYPKLGCRRLVRQFFPTA